MIMMIPMLMMMPMVDRAPKIQVTRNVIHTDIAFPITKDKKARSSMESLMLRIKDMISPRRKLTVRYNSQSKDIMLFSLSSLIFYSKRSSPKKVIPPFTAWSMRSTCSCSGMHSGQYAQQSPTIANAL